MNKICKTCNKDLPIENFRLYRKRKNEEKKYYKSSCKKCSYKSKLQWEKDNPDLDKKIKKKARKKYKSNKNLIRSNKYKERYGITLDQYNKILEDQNYKCKICKTEDTGSKLTSNLCVDHCHKTGKVRGILCNKCNSALGFFKDNKNIIKQALLYLGETHE